MGGTVELRGPDFAKGFQASELPEGATVYGHALGEPVLLSRRDGQFHAIGAVCSHYGAPLGEGLITGDVVRCPWHHARFDLRTGVAVAAPALAPLPWFTTELREESVFVTGKITPPALHRPEALSIGAGQPARVVVIGAGAAGHAAVVELRTQGYRGEITLVGAEGTPPVDRPNLSKDFLAGNAPEEWIPLCDEAFYVQAGVTFLPQTPAEAIDPRARTVRLRDGQVLPYDALLLATGAEPVRLDVPGADLAHVFTLRTLADCRAILQASHGKANAVVIGGGFIGLEVAASLRNQGLAVDVILRDPVPLARQLGSQLGTFVRSLHEDKGVHFHTSAVTSIQADEVLLADGTHLAAQVVVAGVGVKPRVALAQSAGLRVDDGVVVDARMQAAPGIWAAGDIARLPWRGELLRVEHWVHAQRTGQHAARAMLGDRKDFSDVPYFWSAHYDCTINLVGHATGWDDVLVSGSLEDRSATVTYLRGGQTLAVATVGRDLALLEAEVALEDG
jgi:NADPH-dependent 2,4-dienoyl-CoA reductase/sulfur reductase-like enzyme/nitrite reductase/ring-hydroxylating ferredoxin subunit